jgi:Spy/CpxP family protein refolding chaperone
MKTQLTIGIMILSMALINTVSGQQRPPRDDKQGKHQQKEQMHTQMEDRLDLTDQQKTDIETLRTPHMSSTQTLKAKLDVKEAELKLAIINESKGIDESIKEINALRSELFETKISHELAVRSLLTVEQQLIFDKNHMSKAPHSRKGLHRAKLGGK